MHLIRALGLLSATGFVALINSLWAAQRQGHDDLTFNAGFGLRPASLGRTSCTGRCLEIEAIQRRERPAALSGSTEDVQGHLPNSRPPAAATTLRAGTHSWETHAEVSKSEMGQCCRRPIAQNLAGPACLRRAVSFPRPSQVPNYPSIVAGGPGHPRQCGAAANGRQLLTRWRDRGTQQGAGPSGPDRQGRPTTEGRVGNAFWAPSPSPEYYNGGLVRPASRTSGPSLFRQRQTRKAASAMHSNNGRIRRTHEDLDAPTM